MRISRYCLPLEAKINGSPTDPAARWSAASGGPAVYVYADNYLIDLKHSVIMDVEAVTAVRQADRRLINFLPLVVRSIDKFDPSHHI